jgi:hypothetical protein
MRQILKNILRFAIEKRAEIAFCQAVNGAH